MMVVDILVVPGSNLILETDYSAVSRGHIQFLNTNTGISENI